MTPSSARAFQWSDWWLPPVYSEHGRRMDDLFIGIFWITMIILVLVQVTLVVFLIKYRHRPDRKKGQFIHGNSRLEMAWTLAPAVILAVLAFSSRQVWNDYRYPKQVSADKAQIMVIGEQFKWNVIYPGPDGQLGKYLIYPRPTDPKYRALPYKQAVRKINDYIADDNPLGKDMKDPVGKDDDWDKIPARPVIVPRGKQVEVVLGSKDVLHDFFLPNFRVKLDAVPGMFGSVYFTSTTQSTEDLSIDDPALTPDTRLWIDRDTPTSKGDDEGLFTIADPKDPAATAGRFDTLRLMLLHRLATQQISNPTPEQLDSEFAKLRADLKAAGVTRLSAITRPFEIVCEELCGMGHGTMRGELIVVDQKQYDNFIHKTATPSVAMP